MIEVRPQFEINNLSFCSQRCNYCIFRSGHVHTNSWRCSNMCTGMENLNLSQKCPFSLQPLCVMTATHAMYSLNWSIQLKVVSNPSHITCSHQPPLSKSRFYLSTLSYIRLPIWYQMSARAFLLFRNFSDSHYPTSNLWRIPVKYFSFLFSYNVILMFIWWCEGVLFSDATEEDWILHWATHTCLMWPRASSFSFASLWL